MWPTMIILFTWCHNWSGSHFVLIIMKWWSSLLHYTLVQLVLIHWADGAQLYLHTKALGEQRPLPWRIRSSFRVLIRSLDTKLRIQMTSKMQWWLLCPKIHFSDKISMKIGLSLPEMWAKLWKNGLFHRFEESFKNA